MKNEKDNPPQMRPHVKVAFEQSLKERDVLYRKLAHMEAADKIMEEDREVLKRLADS